MSLGHVAVSDASSAGFVLGTALVGMGALRLRRGQRSLGLRMLLTGVLLLVGGVVAALAHEVSRAG